MTNIRASTARRLLYQWHGGQWSPTYAAASSGLVSNFDLLKDEIRDCYARCSTGDSKLVRQDRKDLANLLDWLVKQSAHSALIRASDGRFYHPLPWAQQ